MITKISARETELANALQAVTAERDELRESLKTTFLIEAELRAERDALALDLHTETAAVIALRVERDALKADAERYRWLRRNGNRFYNSINYQGNDEVLDAGIDEAMKGTS